MCSIGEDDYGDEGPLHTMIADVQSMALDSAALGQCSKCSKEETELYHLRFRKPECRDCFLLYVTHKFRATLGSSKVLPKNSKVLLIFDGKAESVVLMDMLYNAQTQTTFKRLHCSTVVLYIDEWHILRNAEDSDGHKRLLTKFAEHLHGYRQEFPSYLAALNDQSTRTTFYGFDNLSHYLADFEDSLSDKLQNLDSLTSRQDYVKRLRRHLVAQAMDHFQCAFAFTSDISNNLAAELLSTIALGRGGSAACDVALVDDRFNDDSGVFKLVRPLKDLNQEEVKLYIRACQLKTLPELPEYGQDQGAAASLQNLTRAFVQNLQENFSATVTTITRTGEKIAETNSQGPKCSFCYSALNASHSTTLEATEFSRLVSMRARDLEQTEEGLQAALKAVGEAKLCHACRNIQEEFAGDSLITSKS